MKSRSRPKKRQGWGLALVLVTGMVLAAFAGFVFVSEVLLASGQSVRLDGPELKALGAADAPVTVVVYSDFQWPYCAQFARGASTQIISDYVSKNEVRFVYRHFPILGERSVRAAAAAEAAAQQGAFWPYHDRLYDVLVAEGGSAFTDERLRAIAQDLQLDLAAFDEAWNAPATQERVQAETREGESKGVRATPTVFINGRKLEGGLPYPVFKSAVDEALQAAR